MKAAFLFRRNLGDRTASTASIVATVFGSLAWTGIGHATDEAILLGLAGEAPDSIDPDRAKALANEILTRQQLTLPGGRTIPFVAERDIVFDKIRTFPHHSNAMTFEAFDASGNLLLRELWYSIGGGFVVREGDAPGAEDSGGRVPFLYRSSDELLAMGQQSGLTIAQMASENECARRTPAEVDAAIDRIADVMLDCIARGLSCEGALPGGLKAQRRAKGIFDQLQSDRALNNSSNTEAIEYVSVFAMAVNEENAAGGRVVTAPTNGAAGVIPAVLRYYLDFYPKATRDGVRTYLLAAAAIGSIIKYNASISGAEVGCQGEVGSASAMAAAGLTAARGGSNEQVENAAEIAMEHHLGMTCDPVGGLVQIPCIERNAFGAVKAITASSLALRGDGTHRVKLDQVIETMRQTGLDMQSKYKETSRGGLAVNVPEC